MFSKVISAGCSFMYGSYDNEKNNDIRTVPYFKDLTIQQHKKTLGDFIAEKFNIEEHICLAKSGHSNKHAIRKIYDQIINKTNSDRYLVVLGLTAFSRSEIMFGDTDEYHPITISDYHLWWEKGNREYGSYQSDISKEKTENYLDLHYTYFTSLKLLSEELAAQLNMLQSLCNLKQTKLVVFFSFFEDYSIGKLPLDFTHTTSKIFLDKKNIFDLFNFGFDKTIIYPWSSFMKLYDNRYSMSHPYTYDNIICSGAIADYVNDIPISPYQIVNKYKPDDSYFSQR